MDKYLSRKNILIVGFAIFFLFSIVWYQISFSTYNVIVDGKVIAQVDDKEEFLKQLETHKKTLSDKLGYQVETLEDVKLKRIKNDTNKITKDYSQIVKEITMATEGYQLIIKGKAMFALKDENKLNQLLEEYKKQFLEGIDDNAEITKIEFKQMEIKKSVIALDNLIDIREAKEVLFANETKQEIIEVQEGDNLWDIAKRKDISLEELQELNPALNPEQVFPGDELVISALDPKLDVEIQFNNTVSEPIPFKTENKRDSSLSSGQQKVLKEGKSGEKRVTYNITLVNGYQSAIKTLKEEVVEEPTNRIVALGTANITVASRGSVSNRRNFQVVQGSRITSNFGARVHPITGKQSFHEGVDIAAPHGNSVSAYQAGKVIFAGWAGGYGNAVYIDHGNGLVTRYAHLSSLYVKTGQTVDKGQKVGAVGSTGNSTGPHLHFEVRKNNTPQNPLNYI